MAAGTESVTPNSRFRFASWELSAWSSRAAGDASRLGARIAGEADDSHDLHHAGDATSAAHSTGAEFLAMRGATLEILADLPDSALHEVVEGTDRREIHFLLYAALRREQAALVATGSHATSEARRILTLAQSAYRDLEVLLAGRTPLLDALRDGDWTLRDFAATCDCDGAPLLRASDLFRDTCG